jgi:hypothetical protein
VQNTGADYTPFFVARCSCSDLAGPLGRRRQKSTPSRDIELSQDAAFQGH